MQFANCIPSQFVVKRRRAGRRRRGNVLVLVTVELVVIFGITALCIDIGWTTLTKSQLQNAADASAAAGAAQLANNYGAYCLPQQKSKHDLIANAKQSASNHSILYGSHNGAGGVDSLTILPGDIEIGFTDANGKYVSSATQSGYPNTVQVKARRDASANGNLPFFFAPVLGRHDATVASRRRTPLDGGRGQRVKQVLLDFRGGGQRQDVAGERACLGGVELLHHLADDRDGARRHAELGEAEADQQADQRRV